MKLTISAAMEDLREEFISRIFKGYPDHKKTWKAEEIESTLSQAMYSISVSYLERAETIK